MAEDRVLCSKMTALDKNGDSTLFKARGWKRETVEYQGDKIVYTMWYCRNQTISSCCIQQRMEWNALGGGYTTKKILENLAKMES